MADVDEILDYIKSLKRGFDKELFQNKIDELSYLVETIGLDYEDFHTLFKLWLNLNIPISKWTNLGVCIVPHEQVKQNTVEFCIRWILANYDNPIYTSRIAFLLDWLTAAMDTDSIDMNALDVGYEVFHTMLTYEALAAHVVKLLYTLTKPADITRKRVLELIDLAITREGKKNMCRQIQVLIGLFKSYKPQYVPENIPSISIHTAFKKINTKLLTRFKSGQSKRNSLSKETVHLFWTNPLNNAPRSKKIDPLVPNVEFTNVGSQQYGDSSKKNYLDFSDPISLLQYSSRHPMSRPARLRALLCSPTGLTLLVVASEEEQVALSHDLYHLLIHSFLEPSAHSYNEKQYLLERLATFQATLLQGLPVVTRFLAQFLPFWNESDFFDEILKLVEWVNVEDTQHIEVILETMARIYHRAQSLEQCAVLRSLTSMYTNLVYASSRQRNFFLDICPSETSYTNALTLIASRVSDMSNKGLQINPESMCVLYSVLCACNKRARAEALCGRAPGSAPRTLCLAAPLLNVSAAAFDALAELILLHKEILSATKAKRSSKDQQYVEQMHILKCFTADFVSCFHEEFLTGRRKGIVFSQLHPHLVSNLETLVPDAESRLSIRNHLAFAPYTYAKVQNIDAREARNSIWFQMVIEEDFDSLSQFVKQAMNLDAQ